MTGPYASNAHYRNVQQFQLQFPSSCRFRLGRLPCFPVITGRGSIDSLDSMSTISDMPPLVAVGSFDSFGRSASPPVSAYVPMTTNGHMVPSYSPSPYPTMLPPMIGLIPANSHPAAGIPVPQHQVMRNSSISVTEWDKKNIQDPTLPNVSSDPNLLGYPSSNSVPRSRSGSPASGLERTRSSTSDYSVGSDGDRDHSAEVAEPSKRELVNRAFFPTSSHVWTELRPKWKPWRKYPSVESKDTNRPRADRSFHPVLSTREFDSICLLSNFYEERASTSSWFSCLPPNEGCTRC
eukprot:TRINITY_DN24_c0_g1_i5.p1 TRINITY_DN24_c0_g1~~TRINITY_DN24_c0_g1_i5.p1  ORF type:complete len:293 (+),score=32.93 TRINITY_DN24_c0_g1_i5:261-1139(+)